MNINLTKYIPRYVRQRDSVLTTYISALSNIMDKHHDNIASIKSLLDVDIMDAKYLPLIVRERGWDCKVVLTELQMRKLIPYIRQILYRRGQISTIIFAINLLFDIQFSVFVPPLDNWVYGDVVKGKYGNTTVYKYYSTTTKYSLVTNAVLDPETIKRINLIINYLRPYGTDYIILSNGTAPIINGKLYWRYGYSHYGKDTTIFKK